VTSRNVRPNVPRLDQPVSNAISVMGRSVSRSMAVARSIRRVSRYRCGGTPERAREMRRRDAADTCESADGPILVRAGVHSIFGAQEASQQLGILASG
jgi:hypothetical protein